MMKTKISLLTLIAVVTLSSPILADPPEPSSTEPSAVRATEEFILEETIALLQIEYNLWLDAALSGSGAEAERLEENLLGRINLDIIVSQEKVRAMAKEVALASGDDVSSGPKVPEVDSDEFKQARNHLNAKEAVFRSAVKTEAFSNKYRLLGDYIDLLRRELKMPRLKLASNQRPSNSAVTRPGADPTSSE